MITGILGILIMPWNLLADPNSLHLHVAGHLRRRHRPHRRRPHRRLLVGPPQNLKLADLYRADGVYRVRQGLELDRRRVAR